MITKSIHGNILDCAEKFIAQQNNCVTVHSRGLAASIAERFPWADVYAERARTGGVASANATKVPSIPGTFTIMRHPTTPEAFPAVICIFGQFSPGKPGAYYKSYPASQEPENAETRLKWFEMAVRGMEQDPAILGNAVAIPARIGCGLAGGDWNRYRQLLERSSINFVLYEL